MRWTLVVVVLALTAGSALAQATSAHATLSGDVAATDNTLSTPTNAEADVYFQLRPGLLFTVDAPRQMHQLSIDAEILEYVRHSDAPSVTERGSWRAIFLPSPLSEISVGAAAGTGKLNAITTGTSADQATVGVLPAGPVDVRNADVDEYGSRALSPAWRIRETLAAHYTGTSDTQSTRSHAGAISGNVGGEYSWRDNAISLDTGLEYLYLERYAPNLPPGPDGSRLTRELTPHASLTWRHDFTRFWSGSVSGGAQYLEPVGTDKYNPGDVARSGLFPLLGAQLSFVDLWGRLTLSGSRALTPNLLIAQNTETTSALVQLALPLPFLDDSRRREPKLVALGTLGYEHTRLIQTDLGATDMVAAAFDVMHADVALGYTPAPGFTYGLRYEFLYQTGSQSPLALVSTFRRNTVFLTFSFRYPARVAVAIPKRQNSARADRKDLAPIGEEVVVPDNPNDGDR